MSSAPADPPSHLVSLSATTSAGVGLGYGIAIAVSILVLISTIMLASYACVRVKSASASAPSNAHTSVAINPASDPAAAAVLGLDEKSIESYPKMVLGQSRRLPEPNNGGSCSICLGEYRAKDVVRSVPGCRHCFHSECVDVWLRVNATCPLCRSSPVPTPLSTPLSELVPLASHPR